MFKALIVYATLILISEYIGAQSHEYTGKYTLLQRDKAFLDLSLPRGISGPSGGFTSMRSSSLCRNI